MSSHDRSRLARSASVFVAGCAFGLLAGCASHAAAEFRPIERPDVPIEHLGLVMYPPPDGAWSLGEKEEEGGAQILFMKDFGAPKSDGKIGPTTYISVNIDCMPAEKFAQNFADQHAALEKLSRIQAQPSSGRFKDLSLETTWGEFKGQEAARVFRRGEERDNPHDPTAVLIVESRSTFVFHPRQPTTVVWVMISQRYPQGLQMPTLSDLEERFLSKLAFK